MNEIDELFIEACEEDAEIEEGYFSENLKFSLDKDIDEDINNSMNSIFDGEGLELSDAVIGLIDRLEIEVNDSESELAKNFIREPEECVEPVDSIIDSHLYDWVDDDNPDQYESVYITNDTGEYNAGYDSIFGDN